jgi:3'(2'), 5'-bisphosphate nucleotidase
MVNRESLDRLIAIARKAGDAIMAHYGTDAGVTQKGDKTPLTNADRDAHQVIVSALEAWTKDVPVISEEGTLPEYEVRKDWTRFWLVDPLDGTKEFLHRNGEFTVNIALIEDGTPVLGVVYAPAMGLMYFAGRGLGSWKQEGAGTPQRLNGKGPGENGLVVVESRSHPSAELEEWLKRVRVARRVQAGSSLKFGLVAEGKADVYPRLGRTMEWDVAAGDAVWRYASGNGEPNESPLAYNTPGLDQPSFVIGRQS